MPGRRRERCASQQGGTSKYAIWDHNLHTSFSRARSSLDIKSRNPINNDVHPYEYTRYKFRPQL